MKIIYYFFLSVILFGCAMNDLTIGVTEPATITLPANIKTIGIVNRTKSTVNKNLNQIDQLVTLELLTVDSTASLKAIDGLFDELQKNTRFEKITNFQSFMLENSTINTFSPIIQKSTIQQICNDNNCQALFVLEYYDTDTKVETKVVPVTTNVLGVEVNAVETEAVVNTGIMLGWRIYDASGDILYDEFPMFQGAVSSGRGINPLKAVSAVVGQKALIENLSYEMGQRYAQDLLPVYVRVYREYYVKGSDNFKIGKRLARAGQWNEAAEYWEKDLNNPKRKVAGRVHYNMAIISEINGDLDAAINWAEKSYTIFNIKKGLHYSRILKDRKLKIEELNRQQGN